MHVVVLSFDQLSFADVPLSPAFSFNKRHLSLTDLSLFSQPHTHTEGTCESKNEQSDADLLMVGLRVQGLGWIRSLCQT
jgi:hypothetical protein